MKRLLSQTTSADQSVGGAVPTSLFVVGTAHPTQSHPSSGSTLSEVLISLLVMSIGVVSLATLFPVSVLRSIQATQLTNAANLPAKKPLFERFMKAYRETIEFIYSSDDALKAYADFLQIPLSRAVQARAQFYPKEGLDPDRIIGIDDLMQEAITARFLTVPLTKEQLAELIQIVPR